MGNGDWYPIVETNEASASFCMQITFFVCPNGSVPSVIIDDPPPKSGPTVLRWKHATAWTLDPLRYQRLFARWPELSKLKLSPLIGLLEWDAQVRNIKLHSRQNQPLGGRRNAPAKQIRACTRRAPIQFGKDGPSADASIEFETRIDNIMAC
jgi:hypothetical protein